jgi:hypothetical protein
VATPANWKDGDDVVISPAIKDEDIPAKFPKGFQRIKYYLDDRNLINRNI